MLAVDNHDQSSVQADAPVVATIASLFKEILNQPDVQLNDDFFELGGDSLAATALVLALGKIGVQLPISVLFDAPTVVELAAVVESMETRPEPSMVVLKPGSELQPVFIAPGLGGSVLEMVPFARKLETSRQIYGLQPRDENGDEVPLLTIEEAAQFYLPLICGVQPHGPYVLAGYSLGGLIALEIGQTLIARGEEVALLIMLDTLTPLGHFPLNGKIRYWARRAADHAGKIRHLPLKQLMPYLMKRANGLAKDLKSETIRIHDRQGSNIPNATQAPKATGAMTATAFTRYRPRFYPGSIAFIQAKIIDEGMPYYPDILWSQLARKLTIHRVGGDHWSMLSRHPGQVAAAFARCLNTIGFSSS